MVYRQPRVSFPSPPYGLTSPVWAGTPGHQPKVLLPGGGHLNGAEFVSAYASKITVGSAGAAAGATTIPVSALPVRIEAGTVLVFGDGTPTGAPGEPAKVTATAEAGATALTVQALAYAIAGGRIASHSTVPQKLVASGTLVGRTWAERDSNIGYGPADLAGDNEIFLLYFDVPDAERENACELYMHNNVVYENFVPDWATLPTATKTWIRTNYHCITGVA